MSADRFDLAVSQVLRALADKLERGELVAKHVHRVPARKRRPPSVEYDPVSGMHRTTDGDPGQLAAITVTLEDRTPGGQALDSIPFTVEMT